ncbi:SNF2 helicase associated domain-containing protein [Bifidobacterium sp. 82T24]|uniref:DEAD/DEAH box helicase n=1 Tax=Bifidobacterium pluvialisilvae TaxID=2834436 RepID=UPI001C58B7E6|nr:DEAD/DEAH box helicase [Bifidobacterium pluvialisilvae]MBW3088520.1 SNF2 helicase associated domain-containing protein [Bifidobacterium pluvialisilvae]
MADDWRARVYGGRGSGASYGGSDGGGFGHSDFGYGFDDAEFSDFGDGYDFGNDADDDVANDDAVDDEGASFGHRDEAISEQTLRVLGGVSFYRAYDVISSGRIHGMACAVGRDGATTLIAMVDSSAGGIGYRVRATLDETHGRVIDTSCSCPAYGRYGSVCKHVIALIMQYNDAPESFDQNAPVGVPGGRPPRPRRTSRMLQAFMQQEDIHQRQEAQSRQVDLLKQVSALADADGADDAGGRSARRGAVGVAALERHMPVGSVSLRPGIVRSASGNGWLLRLRITVPSRSVSYVVKDVDAFLRAVKWQQYVVYGKKLAFTHTMDAFDERSRTGIGLLRRAADIRAGIESHGGGYRGRRAQTSEMLLTDDEITDLLDLYVDSGETVDYASSGYYAASMATDVVDGDPDLGLSVERVDKNGDVVGDDDTDVPNGDDGGSSYGYVVRHRMNVDALIIGQQSSFAIVRASVGSGDGGLPVIHRCSRRFVDDRRIIGVLCDDRDADGLYLGPDDVDMFSRTVLPYVTPIHNVTGSGAVSTVGDNAGTGNAGGADDTDGGIGATAGGERRDCGIPMQLPAELARRKRLPCHIEIYLDRDMHGVSCELKARYGDDRFDVFAGVSPSDAMRDRDVERLAVEAVLHYFPRPDGLVARIPESDDDAIWRLLTEGLPVLRGLGDVFSTPAFDGLTAVNRPTIKVGLSLRSDLVEISPIADEIDPKDVPALLAGYRSRRKYHRLSNGAFVNLRDVNTKAIDDIAADLGIRADELAAGVRVPAYEAYYLDHEVDDGDKDERFRDYVNDLKVIDPASYTVPSSLATVLRPYQVEGFRWLNAICDKGFGGILADEMGLGKTVQLLSLLVSRRGEFRKVGPNLIVCPASLVYNWAAECAKFAPELTVEVVAGTKAERRRILEAARGGAGDVDAGVVVGTAGDGTTDGTDPRAAVPDVLITSYDLLRRDIADYDGIACCCMVLDEAQYVKNHATKSSKAVRSVAARHRFALTGTPIENRLAELWSIFDFLMPGMFGSYAHFRERFEMPILSGDEQAQARLQAFVGPFILRRRKADVLKDLPEKIENVITVRLEGEQRRLYAALEQRLRATLNKQKDKDFNTGKIQVLAQLTRLRQACCDPRLLYANYGGDLPESGAGASGKRVKAPKSAKLDAIEELVLSCRDAGRKMLIFSQFTSYLDLIAERLRRDDIAYDVITGSTPKKRRLELVDAFNADDTPVFLISLKAGNTGLNLTGACVVVHADPWWNAAAQDQATDRAHRIGQTQDVNVYQIVAKDTIEERILNLQHSKTDLASRFVDAASSSGNAISALTRDDLLALLD